MSNSPEYMELKSAAATTTTAAPAGRQTPEKSSFSQTCNLLSQYLKEKRNFGDLSLGMPCNGDGTGNANGMPEILRHEATTMNFFPVTEKPVEVSSRKSGSPPSYRSMDLFPQQVGFAPSASEEDVQRKAETGTKKSSSQEPRTAQMTIFYGGQVIVFDNFPADKAKEVMLLAGEGSSLGQAGNPVTPVKSLSAFAPNMAKSPVEPSSSIPSSSNDVSNFGKTLYQEHIKRAAPISELPMARRASLHRFLAKRKDRLVVKAPYQTSSPMTAHTKPAENKSWLGLAAQSPQY